MNRAHPVIGCLLALMLAACSTGQDSDRMADDAPEGRAAINFANFGGSIRDWRAVGSEAILIQAVGGDWYRAEFMSRCNQLPFANEIGFVTHSTNQIDRFSSILVRHERCWFKSFEPVDAPE